jgi:hypothetical protein
MAKYYGPRMVNTPQPPTPQPNSWVYPNPGKGLFTIDSRPFNWQAYDLEVVDINSRQLLKKRMK